MLVARAYTLRQQSRLAISLSWIAGFTNVVTLAWTGMMVSHVTGNLTHFGQTVAAFQWRTAALCIFLPICFMLGAMLSALSIQIARRMHRRSIYILPMSLQALLLGGLSALISIVNIHRHPDGAVVIPVPILLGMLALGSLAMGLQNATITSISGAVVRTTHLTGVTTDIGTSLVDFCAWIFDRTRRRGRERWRRVIKAARRQSDLQRLALLTSIVGSFFFGVVIGILSFNFEPAIGLAPPVAFLLFILYIDWREPIADVKEINRLADPELLQHGIAPSLLPSSIGLYRLSPPPAGLKHHAPDFTSWIAEVPGRVKVCVLSLSHGLQLDHEAAASLTTIAGRLRDDGRRLILAQVTAQDFEVFGEIESKEPFDPKDLCSDLEFAIARAMSVT